MSETPDSINGSEQIAVNNTHEQSPLWMVMDEPVLNELVFELVRVKNLVERFPDQVHLLNFSRERLGLARNAFDRMIRRGEESLHKICEHFCDSFLNNYQIESVVIGQGPESNERFTLTQIISRADLYSTIDLDLGNRQLDKILYKEGENWSNPELVANVVEYQPTEPNRFGIYKIISRIKAEEELWNKVVDEIFGLDSLVRQDKQLRHLSRYVKDVFGVKVVVGTTAEANKLQEVLKQQLEIIEEKDYLASKERKDSGWEAIKSVVRWNDRIFEIQIQPLKNFWKEKEFLTKESHAGFKSRRSEVREQVALQIPLFKFYQELLKWLFSDPDGSMPTFPGISLSVML